MSLLILFLFVMGSVWGSFLNVVIVRSAKGKSFVSGRSECDKCRHQLSWKDLIPLFSFLFLRGKCAYCHKKISIINILMEVLTGIFFVWWFLVGFGFFRLVGSPWQLLQPTFWLIVGLIFIVIFVIDLIYMIIPFWINMALLSIVILYKVLLVYSLNMKLGDFVQSIESALFLSFMLIVLNKLTMFFKGVEGFGLGDIYLAPSLGLLLGWPKIVPGIFLSFIFGSVVGICLIFFGKRKINDYLPFGPFLILGTVLGLLYGNQMWSWYMSYFV